MSIQGKKVLVFSAHAADYVWRAGGTICRYIDEGAEVKVICVSLGIRGESNDLWKQGLNEEQVRATRRAETEKAAGILGITNFEIWDLQDYPIVCDKALEDRIVKEIRTFRPDIILTHDRYDVLNPDHDNISKLVYRCGIMSNSSGVIVEGTKATKQMQFYGFEPHQTELSDYKPGCFINITSAYDRKVAAMKCFQAQKHLIQYYTDRAYMRGNHARRLSGDNSIAYAESFAPVFPYVGNEFCLYE